MTVAMSTALGCVRLSACCSFAMQPLNFVLSATRVCDNFTGIVEFLPAALINLHRRGGGDLRQKLVVAALALWSARLGGFLIRRMCVRSAMDARLDDLRSRGLPALACFWVVHGTWGLVVSLPATLCGLYVPGKPWGVCDVVGFAAWTAGFVLEAVGDARKAAYRERGAPGRYYDVGGDPLWTWSRYPHLAGEVLCWLGLAVVAAAAVEPRPWKFAPLLSPLMTLGLMVGEAAHLAEVKNAERYQDSADFKRYRATTSLLWPVPRSVYARVPRSLRACLFFDYY